MSIADRFATPSTASVVASVPVPPLQNGDHLSRIEFERRCLTRPDVKKAELIEGIVYMPSPVSLRHAQPHAATVGWIAYYVSKTPSLLLVDNATCRLDGINEPQPDVMLIIPSAAGGRSQVDEDNYLNGPPDLACEVAVSSVSIDLHAKKNAYERNGVQEYVVWRVEDGAIDWFELVNGRYQLIAADDKGRLHSRMFPGLWLDATAILGGDLRKVFAAIDEGTATPEHAAFVKRLADATRAAGS